MIIAVDFDGVVHDYTEGWKGGKIYGKPVQTSRWALGYLCRHGHQVLIYTCRAYSGTVNGRKVRGKKREIAAWMKQHAIPYTEIWTGRGKPAADIYVDDRAVEFRGHWPVTLEHILKFSTWQGHRTRQDEIKQPRTKKAK